MNEEDESDDGSVNDELKEACREVLGLEKEKTRLTLAEFYAPTPDILESAPGLEYSEDDLEFEFTTEQDSDGLQSMSDQACSRRAGPKSNYHSKQCTSNSSEKCVGNHYHDLDLGTRECVDEEVKKELAMLQDKNILNELHTQYADYSIESKLNPKFDFSSKVKTNRAFTEKVKHDKSKQISVSLADNYALPTERSPLSNKHFDFVPVQTSGGKSKYVINNYSSPRNNDKENKFNREETLESGTQWKGRHTQAPLIALQRSKAIYKNQYLPSIQTTKRKSPTRHQYHPSKVEEHLPGNKEDPVDVFYSHVQLSSKHPVHLGMPISRHYGARGSLHGRCSDLSMTTTSSCNSATSLSTGFSGISKESQRYYGDKTWSAKRTGCLTRSSSTARYGIEVNGNNKPRGQLKVTSHLADSCDGNSTVEQVPMLLGHRFN